MVNKMFRTDEQRKAMFARMHEGSFSCDPKFAALPEGVLDRSRPIDEQRAYYRKIGEENGLTGKKLENYVEFMPRAFTDGYTGKSYADEWADRFAEGKEWFRSDNSRKRVLEDVDPEHYSGLGPGETVLYSEEPTVVVRDGKNVAIFKKSFLEEMEKPIVKVERKPDIMDILEREKSAKKKDLSMAPMRVYGGERSDEESEE